MYLSDNYSSMTWGFEEIPCKQSACEHKIFLLLAIMLFLCVVITPYGTEFYGELKF